MHKNPTNLKEVRENLAEAAYTAWIDKSFVNRAVVMVNAMGKIVTTAALSLKAAELSKQACSDPLLQCDATPRLPDAESE